jgi:hypothetical protein
MSRAAGLCRSCGGPRRGRAARTAAPAGQCTRCGDDVCYPKHSDWFSEEDEGRGGYVCNKCLRAAKQQVT